MKLSELKNKIMKDVELYNIYEELKFKEDISLQIIKARNKINITQLELANLINTKQPSIARLENGNSLPSLTLLLRIAKALNTKINMEFEINKIESTHTVTVVNKVSENINNNIATFQTSSSLNTIKQFIN